MAISRIRTVFTGVAGSPYYSNLYFQGNATATTINAVGAMFEAIDSFQRNELAWQVEDDVPVFDEFDGSLIEVLSLVGPSGVGTLADEAIAPATQVLLQFQTGGIVHNRRVRGRMFVPSLTLAAMDDGVPSITTRNGIEAAYTDNLQATAVRDTTPHVIWSRPWHPDPPQPENPDRDGTSHIVTNGQVWTQFAVQRSRRD